MRLCLTISPSQILDIYYNMELSRQLDNKQLILLKQGKGYFHIGGSGHEAAGMAAALSIKPGIDFAYPYYRDQAFCLGLGMTSRDHLLAFLAIPHFFRLSTSILPSEFSSTFETNENFSIDSVHYI